MCKRLRIICLFALSGLLLTGCENDIDLFVSADPIPVVYGVLCPDDSVHQIRLTRSFGADYDWMRDAKINDSLYYDEAEVLLELRSDKGFVLERFAFTESVVEDKDEGLFSTSPNRVFELRDVTLRQPRGGDESINYLLTINIPFYKKAVFSEVEMPGSPSINSNISSDEALNFYSYYEDPLYIVISRNRNFASEYEIVIHYQEQRNGNWFPNQVRSIRQYGLESKMGSKPDSIKITPEWFYGILKARIKDDPEVEKRKFASIEISKKFLSMEFYNYQRSIDYQSDFYSNILTNIINGKGVFSFYTESGISGVQLHSNSIDSLISGQYTKHLNFIRN